MNTTDNENRSFVLRLVLLSFLSLFFELLIIRWFSSDFRLFTVFRTLPLITCFVGLGIGFGVSKSEVFKKYALVAMLQTAATVKIAEYFKVSEFRFPSTSTYYFQNVNMTDALYVVTCLLVMILLLAGPLAVSIALGSELGVLFSQTKPLKAYTMNLAGSIIGSIAFGVLCFLGLAPEVLFLVSLLLLVVTSEKINWPVVLVAAVVPLIPLSLTNVVAANGYQIEDSTYWSPYQRLDLSVYSMPDKPNPNKFFGLNIGTNRSFYQYFFSDQLKVEDAPADWQKMISDRRRQYELPFQLTKDVKDVLILGAGTGQNVGPALTNGATHVDAVDIDPVILQIGKKYNPAYGDAKVSAICDDARHFMKATDKKYDLIIFTLLDSQAVLGSGSSIRLDTYVYTKQSIEQAVSLLKPNGVIVLSFCCLPWISERLHLTMSQAAGYAPLVAVLPGDHAWGPADVFFFLGEPVRNKTVQLPAPWVAAAVDTKPDTRLLTDDWPYLYVRNNVVDVPYLCAALMVILLAAYAGRRVLFGHRCRSCWQLFMLGAAFMLLELHGISLLSLVYGSTWLTSAIVINSILILLFIANLFITSLGDKLKTHQSLLYILLFSSIGLSYFVEPHSVLHALPGFSGELLLTIITLLPLGLAGLVFPIALSENQSISQAFAYNLFGAVIGGLLEYLSNYIGIVNLELVALGLYMAAMVIRQPWSDKAKAP